MTKTYQVKLNNGKTVEVEAEGIVAEKDWLKFLDRDRIFLLFNRDAVISCWLKEQ